MCKSLGVLGYVASAHPDRELDQGSIQMLRADASARAISEPGSRLAGLASAVFRSSPDFARFALLNHGREGYLHKSARR
jgi:hypothetical protein